MWVVVRQTSYPMASLWSNPDAFGKEVSHKGLIGSTIQNGSIPRLFSNQSRVCHLDSSWIWDLKVTFPSLDSLDVCFKKVISFIGCFHFWKAFGSDEREAAGLMRSESHVFSKCHCMILHAVHQRICATCLGFNLWLPSYLDGCSPQREEMVHNYFSYLILGCLIHLIHFYVGFCQANSVSTKTGWIRSPGLKAVRCRWLLY